MSNLSDITSTLKSERTTATPSTDILLNGLLRSERDSWHFYIAMSCLCLLNLVAAWDATSLPITLLTITAALKGTALQAFWLGISFLIPAAVLQPFYGSLSAIFGRKPIILVALIFFSAGAVLCAVSNSFTAMIFGRSIQGIGAGGIYALSNIIVTDIAPNEERSKCLATIGAMWAIGGITGPILGGALAQNGHWRWIFWINLPFGGTIAVVIAAFLHLQSEDGNMLGKMKKVDWLGCFLLTGSLTSLLIAVTWGGIVGPRNTWRTMLPVEIGLVGFMFFLIWTWFNPGENYIALNWSTSPTSICAYFGTMVHGMVLWSALYLMPLYFQATRKQSPLEVGISLLPWLSIVGLFALAAAVFVNRTYQYCPAIWLGWALSTFGIALFILFTRSTPASTWAGLSILSGIGLGILAPALALTCQAPYRSKEIPTAIGLHSFFHGLGRVLGVAVGSAVFQKELLRNMLQQPDIERSALDFTQNAVGLVKTIQKISGGDDTLKFILMNTYVHSLRTVWIVMAACAGAASLLGLICTRAYPPQRETGRSKAINTKTFDEER
ncbi:MFS general substrate transporter [Delitschia confertaspora ATCC 74209]|uniref:MFS general substrate transporter n=1 Tax=Delitschia confertaspora ATCC 74209 TaxID=1513339 RepID=A0A9P4JXU7_9PLEO|nr:MFS general substrate transporter [Delitschia confertaspora ATCC 74209]